MKTYNQNNGQFNGDDKKSEEKPGMGNHTTPDHKSKPDEESKK